MLRRITSTLFGLALLASIPHAMAQLYYDLPQLEREVRNACPKRWEEIRGFIDHIDHEEHRVLYSEDMHDDMVDIWAGDPVDLHEYVKFAIRNLQGADGSIYLNYSETASVISVCAEVREIYFSVLEEKHHSDNGGAAGLADLIAKLTDDDDDGVFNYWDTHEDCQATPPELERPENDPVFTFIDLDNDGEHDDPTRPAGCAESELDYDGDGVSNLIDQCKDSPQSAIDNNLIHTDGCTDSDQDNQSDPNDPYPFQDDTQCTP